MTKFVKLNQYDYLCYPLPKYDTYKHLNDGVFIVETSTGEGCVFNVSHNCTFNIGKDCTIDAPSPVTIKAGDRSVYIRRDSYEVVATVLTSGVTIKFYEGIEGCKVNTSEYCAKYINDENGMMAILALNEYVEPLELTKYKRVSHV